VVSLSLRSQLLIGLGQIIFVLAHFFGLSFAWTLVLAIWWAALIVILYQAMYLAKRSVIWIGLAVTMIPVSTTILGNAMVPMYYLMGHSMHGGGASDVAHGVLMQSDEKAVSIKLSTNIQRPLHVAAYTGESNLIIRSGDKKQTVLFVTNRSDTTVDIRMKLAMVPGNLDHFIQVTLPKTMILGPGESLDIPFEVVVKKLPAQLEMGLVQINLMDASHVGEQGKQQYWKKMTIPADEMQMRMKNE
jgi:cytochrome c oxidase assembly protein Cox11